MKRTILHPIWVLMSTTLPLLIFSFLLYGNYQIIKSEFGESEIELWNQLWMALGALIIPATLYSLLCWFWQKNTQLLYSIISLVAACLFLYGFTMNFEDAIPSGVPPWMLEEQDLLIYAFTFLMPTILYGAFSIVMHLTPNEQDRSALLNFGIALCFPAFAYFMITTGAELFRGIESFHFFLVLNIVGVTLFMFFLLRTFYILLSRQSTWWKRMRFLWLMPVALIMPLLGLSLNGGELVAERTFFCLFGDFRHALFYVFTIINAILYCIPQINHPTSRILLFIGRSITFTFIFYFFLVFLPFLPLSIIAIIAFGAGFLMLSPVLLFFIQGNILSEDYAYLRTHYKKGLLIPLMIGGMLVIPTFLVGWYKMEQRNLLKAIDYIYHPTYGEEIPHVNTTRLKNTIEKIKHLKNTDDRDRLDRGQEGYLPYLSHLFRYMVLDNGTLSNQRLHDIEQVFIGDVFDFPDIPWDRGPRSGDVFIDSIGVTSRYDYRHEAWISEVYLELQNYGLGNQEYETHFYLPDGALISDYYLWIENRKEYGLLTEKRAAQWVYRQITNLRRDPGLLFYEKDGSISFQVFPCPSNGPRRTGIEIIHKDPFLFQIDNKKVLLGDTLETASTAIIQIADMGTYIPAAAKETLPQVSRKPYYYVLVDASSGSISNYVERISTWIKEHNIQYGINMKLVVVNQGHRTIGAKVVWQQQLEKMISKSLQEGGFFLERAMREIYFQQLQQEKNTYPVMIVVTDELTKAAFPNDGLPDLAQAYPECPYFYTLDDSAKVRGHSLISGVRFQLSNIPFPPETRPVYQYKEGAITHYLPMDKKPSLVVNIPTDIEKEIWMAGEKNWERGLQLQAYYQQLQWNPKHYDQRWLHLLQSSFKQHFMTPINSFIVVETEAQKQALLAAQQKILNAGNTKFDFGEEQADWNRMSEPAWYVVLGLFLLVLLGRRWRELLHTN